MLFNTFEFLRFVIFSLFFPKSARSNPINFVFLIDVSSLCDLIIVTTPLMKTSSKKVLLRVGLVAVNTAHRPDPPGPSTQQHEPP